MLGHQPELLGGEQLGQQPRREAIPDIVGRFQHGCSQELPVYNDVRISPDARTRKVAAVQDKTRKALSTAIRGETLRVAMCNTLQLDGKRPERALVHTQ